MNRKLEGSVLLNVIFLIAIMFLVFNRREAESAYPAAAPVQDVRHTLESTAPKPDIALAPPELADIYKRATEAGLPPRVINRFLAAAVQDMVVASATDSQYWVSPLVRQARQQQNLITAQGKGRELIVGIVGTSGAADPAFASLFRPLDPQYSFLPSAKQIEVQRLLVNAQQQRLSVAVVGPGSMSERARIERSLRNDLKKVLSAEEMLEYDLRNSPAAQVLLSSGFDFTESEYRDVFKVMHAGEPDLPPIGSLAAFGGQGVRNDSKLGKIQQALGDQRFREYIKIQDPSYKLLVSIAHARNLAAGAVDESYGILRDASAQIESVRGSGALLTPQQLTAIKKLENQRDTRLRQVLGEDAYADMLRTLQPGGPMFDSGVDWRPPLAGTH
jgi:hypothetical protein